MFEIYKFKYNTKRKGDLGITIFARTRETADKIVGVLNDRYKDLEPYEPKRIGFKKKVYFNIPPYELEQEQMEFMKKWKRN